MQTTFKLEEERRANESVWENENCFICFSINAFDGMQIGKECDVSRERKHRISIFSFTSIEIRSSDKLGEKNSWHLPGNWKYWERRKKTPLYPNVQFFFPFNHFFHFHLKIIKIRQKNCNHSIIDWFFVFNQSEC